MLDETPSGWAVKPLKDICQIQTGKTPSTKEPENWNGNIPFVTPTDLDGSVYVGDAERKVSDSALSKLKLIPPGSVLFTCIASIGKSAINTTACVTNQQINTCIANDQVSSEFLYYQLQNRVGEISDLAGKTAVAIINKGKFSEFPVLLPPLPEQERIAEILTSVDDSIRATEAVIAQAERVKRGLMEDLMPRDGETVQLSNLSAFITKGATPTTYGFEWQSEGIPFLRSECVSENGFTESGLAYICDGAHAAMERSVIKPGDLLITITGNVGRVAVLPDDFQEANINQHIARVRIVNEAFDRDFVYHFLSSPRQRAHYQSIVTGQAYPQLSLKQIRETEIPVMPMEQQKKIASVLNAADAGLSINQQSIDQLQRLKRGLMDDLLTGRVRAV